MVDAHLPVPGTPVEQLDTPTLLINLDAAEANIAKLQSWCDLNGVSNRPHAKTHKSAYWGQKQIRAGAIGLCASKISEAEILVDGGITEVLITSEIIGPYKIARLMHLAKRSNLIVAADSANNIKQLGQAAVHSGINLGVLIEINVGQNRCGVDTDLQALELARLVSDMPGLRFDGVMGYEGHLMSVRDEKVRTYQANMAAAHLESIADHLHANGLPVQVVSAGGTGTYNITGANHRVTDIQPGSYIFMDGDYLGLFDHFQMALTVLVTVVSTPVSDRVVMDGGRKSISIDRGLPQVIGLEGQVRISEEHLVVDLAGNSNLAPKIGDRIQVLPVHGDTTIAQHDRYYGIRGGLLEEVIEISGRGMFT